MPLRRNKMVETAYPLRSTVTEYVGVIIFFQSRKIDFLIYGQDIAATKKEQISTSYEHTQYREYISHREELNLWR